MENPFVVDRKSQYFKIKKVAPMSVVRIHEEYASKKFSCRFKLEPVVCRCP